MKKIFSLFAAILFAGSMMAADPYTLQFNYYDNTSSDKSAAETELSGLFNEASMAYLSTDGAVLDKVYLGRKYKDKVSGDSVFSNVKFGTSSAAGTLKFALKNMAVDSVIFRAAMYGDNEGGDGFSVNGTAFTLSAGNKAFENLTYVPAGEITALEIAQTKANKGRFYLTSITVYPSEGGVTPPVGSPKYYVAGSMNGWGPNAAYELVANPANAGEYMGEFTFAAGDAFKVIKDQGEATYQWYPEGMGNDYSITEAGDYKIFFRPEGGVEGWYYGFFNVMMKEPELPLTCAAIYSLEKNTEVALNDVVVTYVNGRNVWVKDATASLLLYLTADATWAAGDTLSGVAGVVDIYQSLVYEVKLNADQAAAVAATAGAAPAAEELAAVTNADVNKYIVLKEIALEGEFTAEAQSNLNVVLGGDTVVLRNQFKYAYNFVANKKYNVTAVVSGYKGKVQLYFIDAEVAEAPGTPHYFIAGSMNNWGPAEGYELFENPNNAGEYMGEFTFAAGDAFKVIMSNGSASYTWYPEGMGNDYTINQDGEYVVYFRPEGGVSDWYYGFFNVIMVEPQTPIDITISSLTAPGTIFYVDAIATYGYWDFYGWNDEYDIEISNSYSEVAAGTYAIEDLDDNYTYIVPVEGDTIRFVAGQVVLSINNDVVNLAGQLKGNNGKLYNINLTYKDPVVEKTVLVNIANAELYDAYADYGLYVVYGEDANEVYVQLSIWAETGFQGNFTEEDLDNQIVGSGLYDAEGNPQSIYTAAIEVIPGDAEGDYLVKADLLCYNNTLYKVTMTISAEQGIDAVNAATKAIKSLVNGKLFIEKAGKTYNANGTVIR